ncbi:MAG: C4-type zinc ribbon domain-containing protein [Candidatus Omnitrophica bacterium]|nr:C4-type zinc ribbon domain-containing protein [Candidatus Omnitrophota bacterium]MDD5512701.1 C4-type zinc ribbon domain-containing protein [Candidatus Omnitrophota bacterium]
MSTVDLKTQITTLAKLQTVDSEIYALKKEKSAQPDLLKSLDAAFEEKKSGVASAEKLLLDLQKEKKEREVELGSKEESGKKLQTQLYQLKTNKEYQAMLQQIADAKADASLFEDKILESMEKIDKAKVALEEEKKKLQQEEGVSSTEKKKISDRGKQIDDRLAQLEAQRAQSSSGIDPEILAQYERILANRDGLAIVTVKDNSCQGCNMYVPPQVINLIRMYERIITCEVCNRILYIEE